MDPGRQHHAGVQGLGSHPEVDDASVVHGPDVLAAAAHTDQTNVALKNKTEAARRELDPHAGKKHIDCDLKIEKCFVDPNSAEDRTAPGEAEATGEVNSPLGTLA